MSEEDQEFYVPASPVRTVAGWSDAGHDTLTSFVSNPTRHSMSVSTPSAHPSIVAAAGGRQTSTGSSVVPGTSWDNYPSTSFDNNAAAVRRANSSSSSKGGSSGADPVATAVPISSAPSSANPKRSSFVVLRGAKGDAELAQRKTDAQSVATSDGDQDQVLGGLDGGQQGGSTQLRHKNSLKPFLDAEAAVVGGEEEWEKSLKDERNKEEMELVRLISMSALPSMEADTRPFTIVQGQRAALVFVSDCKRQHTFLSFSRHDIRARGCNRIVESLERRSRRFRRRRPPTSKPQQLQTVSQRARPDAGYESGQLGRSLTSHEQQRRDARVKIAFCCRQQLYSFTGWNKSCTSGIAAIKPSTITQSALWHFSRPLEFAERRHWHATSRTACRSEPLQLARSRDAVPRFPSLTVESDNRRDEAAQHYQRDQQQADRCAWRFESGREHELAGQSS